MSQREPATMCAVERSSPPGRGPRGAPVPRLGLGLAAVLAVAAAHAPGCGAPARQEAGPVVTVAPDEFVLRDVRRDAARYLDCQAPMIDVRIDDWAGSRGTVIAGGCGYRVMYHVTCETSHQCQFSATD